MKYNIEKIKLIAQKVAEVVQEAIEAESQEQVLIGDVELAMRESVRQIGQQALTCFLESADGKAEAERKEQVLIGDVELAMRESVRQIGQQALTCFLESADGKAEAEIPCPCGGQLKYQRQRKA